MANQSSLPATGQQSNLTTDEYGLGVVQIFLNAAIACIAHSRELIPWVSPCFQTRYTNQLAIDVDNAKTMYADFCGSPVEEKAGSTTQEFRILQRGKDRRADRILDLLDGGVADALTRGYLEAFQFFVTADTKDPAATLEVYAFTFTYSQQTLEAITISQTTDQFSTKDVHLSFNSAIRTLLKHLKDCPRLPRRRNIGISLLYNESCPSDYQPSGFIDAKQYRPVPLRESWVDLWQDLPTPVTEFVSRSRKVEVGLLNLQHTDHMSRSRLMDTRVSEQIKQLQRTSSRDQQLNPTQDLSSHTEFDSSALVQSQHNTVQSETHQNQDLQLGKQTKVSDLDNSRAETVKVQKRSANGLATLSVSSKNRRRRNVVAGKIAELLLQARAMENNSRSPDSIFDVAQLQHCKIRRLKKSTTIRCECGSNHTASNMLSCGLCGTSQHKVCYGYELLRQGCLPEEHFCYNCLLLPREDQVNRLMPGIVHMRLALTFLSRQPTSEISVGPEFRRSVFGREDTTEASTKLIDRLTTEGFLSQPIDGVAHILDDIDLSGAQSTYLDPLAAIIHHYQIVRDGDTSEKRRSDIEKAFRMYVGERKCSLSDTTNSSYDRIHVKNNIGQEILRWGLYASWKRKRVDDLDTSIARRKISISNTFVSVNRSTPSEPMSMSDVMQEAVSEAEWGVCLNGCLRCGDTGLY